MHIGLDKLRKSSYVSALINFNVQNVPKNKHANWFIVVPVVRKLLFNVFNEVPHHARACACDTAARQGENYAIL